MNQSRLRLDVLEERYMLTTLSVFQRQANPLASFFAVAGAVDVGTDGGSSNRVQVRRRSDGSLIADFVPFPSTYRGGVTVAVGDVNHDAIDDLIVGRAESPADGTADTLPQVKIFSGVAFQNGTFQVGNPNLSLLAQFSPYASRFHVGVNVAAGDIDNNGFANIITGPTSGNPDVRVFRGQDIVNHNFNPVAQWFAYGLNFNVGANVASGDVNADGFADVATGATSGNPHVKVYNGRDIATGHFNPDGPSLMASFFADQLGRNIGAFVAVGDTIGDGFADVITGQTRGGSLVKVFDGRAIAEAAIPDNRRVFNPNTDLLDQFFAFPPASDPGGADGVTVASSDFAVPARFDILTGNAHSAPQFRVVPGNAHGTRPPTVNGIDGFALNIPGGIFVGA